MIVFVVKLMTEKDPLIENQKDKDKVTPGRTLEQITGMTLRQRRPSMLSLMLLRAQGLMHRPMRTRMEVRVSGRPGWQGFRALRSQDTVDHTDSCMRNRPTGVAPGLATGDRNKGTTVGSDDETGKYDLLLGS